MRTYMRGLHLDEEPDETGAKAVGMTGGQMEEMYRLLAIAKYDDRYVIPTTSSETPRGLAELGCSLDSFGGPGMGGTGYAQPGGGTKTFVPLEVRR